MRIPNADRAVIEPAKLRGYVLSRSHPVGRFKAAFLVEVYEPDGLDVEFVTASGRTAALLTLSVRDVRPVSDNDLVSVRPCRCSA